MLLSGFIRVSLSLMLLSGFIRVSLSIMLFDVLHLTRVSVLNVA